MTPKPPPLKLVMGVRDEQDGFLVTVNERAATTPRRNPVIVPTRALARAIKNELTAAPGILAGKGLNDPAAAPCFRIAAGAIDVVAPDITTRAGVERELTGYGATDLVCLRAERPAELVARECAAWDPLCHWFARRFGVSLALGTGVMALRQASAVADALAAAAAACDPFRLAALSLATRSAGSVVIGLALCEGEIDAEAAFAAAVIEETFQEEKWGADREAAAARAVKRLDLAQAARFVELLSEA